MYTVILQNVVSYGLWIGNHRTGMVNRRMQVYSSKKSVGIFAKGIEVIPIYVLSNSFPFPIWSLIPIPMGLPLDYSHSCRESHFHGHLYFIVHQSVKHCHKLSEMPLKFN